MEDIIIPDKDELERKIALLKKDGASQLHVVSDFDKTLTKAFVLGHKVHSSYATLRNSPDVTEELKELEDSLYKKYNPIEISPNVPLETKKEKMTEWWDTYFNMLINLKLEEKVFENLKKEDNIEAREGCFEFLDTLHKNNIPLLVFSAGIGNIIKGFFGSKGILYENTHVVSNFVVFRNGVAESYTKPLIHVFSKNEVSIKKTPYHNEIEHRRNVILIGDSLGDLGMSEGIKHDNIIRIGFLNEKIEQQLPEYRKNFDVLIVNDGTMDYVNRLMKDILNKK